MKNSKKICIEFAWNIVAVISCRQIAIKIVVTFKEYKPILKHHPNFILTQENYKILIKIVN